MSGEQFDHRIHLKFVKWKVIKN